MLRVCAHVLGGHGPEAISRLYPALGSRIFDVPPEAGSDIPGKTRALVEAALVETVLPPDFADFLEDASRDEQIQAGGSRSSLDTSNCPSAHPLGSPQHTQGTAHGPVSHSR